ncbi:hypothetical protein MRB53_038602 [Persea americana]|nr:hypothetical protein MRB53_038602 [Persea americana]
MLLPIIILTVLFLLIASLVRLLTLHPLYNPPARNTRRPSSTPTRLLIILGSGGHTAEMFAILRKLDCTKYNHRSYVVSSGDAFSVSKAQEFEAQLEREMLETAAADETKQQQYGWYDVSVVPRARKIHQSLLTTPWSSLKCPVGMLQGLASNWSHCDTGVLYHTLLFHRSDERTDADDICGELGAGAATQSERKVPLARCDRFLVQWEALEKLTKGKGEYIGVLV